MASNDTTRRETITTPPTDVRRFIFSGGVQWEGHTIDNGVMLSTARVVGRLGRTVGTFVVERRVQKKQGPDYGAATYRAALVGTSDWHPFDVADASGVFVGDPADPATMNLDALVRELRKQGEAIAKLQHDIEALRKK